MKIALVQMELKEKNHAGNTAHGLEMLETAARKSDLAILPEIWTTGYSLGHLQEQAETMDSPLVKELQALAVRTNCDLIPGSVPMRWEDGKIYNTILAINREGKIVSRYGKAHLFGMFNEEQFFASGHRFDVYELNGIKCGSTACYDMRFPELYRYLALKDAQLLVVPAEWPERRGYAWDILSRARAIENHLFIATVNAVGTFKKDIFYGHSRLVDPNGFVVAEAGEGEEIVYADMDPSRSEETRRYLNSLQDVRLRISVPPFDDRKDVGKGAPR
ncbi:MAG: CN hydrolase domain-containing protein [Succiniclasticum sp.]|jgi:omega-amidase